MFNPVSAAAVGKVAEGVLSGLDGLFTSDEERKQAELSIMQELNKPHILQAMTNIEEAKHPSLFVAGWRPSLGWLCVGLLGYAWVLRDFLIIYLSQTDMDVVLPVVESGEMMTLVLALLGLGATRTYEKMNGVARGTWSVDKKK